MLKALSTGWRFRLAMLLAALAAACFVAPPAVMAFDHGEMTAHCLEMAVTSQHGMADHTGHKGDADGVHQHKKAPAEKQDAGCCGLFCLSALPSAPAAALRPHDASSSHLRPPVVSLSFGAPDGLDRPPKSPLVA